MKLLTNFEVTKNIKDLYRKINCVVLAYPTFNNFPRPGKGHTLYIDESIEPNEIWRLDCDLKDYVQVGGGGTDPIAGPGIQFSQFSTAFETTFQLLILEDVINVPTIVPFDIVSNEGTHVTGDINTFKFTVNETGWYNFYFDGTFTFANITTSQITGQIYINDTYVDYSAISGRHAGGSNDQYHLSMTRKLSLAEGDVVDFRVSRPFLSGTSDITINNAEMSLERISLGGIILGGDDEIQISANYATLPAPGTETNLWRWVVNTVGEYPSGLYYSDGVTWETSNNKADWNAVSGPSEILNKPTIPVKTLVSGVSLIAANFTLVSGYYEYDYSNVLITTQSLITVVPLNSTISIVSAAVFLPNITTSAGSAKLYCTNLPSGNMDVDIWILT